MAAENQTRASAARTIIQSIQQLPEPTSEGPSARSCQGVLASATRAKLIASGTLDAVSLAVFCSTAYRAACASRTLCIAGATRTIYFALGPGRTIRVAAACFTANATIRT